MLDADEQTPDPVEPARVVDPHGRVEFEHISFRYKADEPLIDDLSLVAEPGHTVAIVGPTGAGKTTLVNLVMRFYELDAGRITLDGVDITTMRRDDLRGRIGMVLQDSWLFGGTIRDNIAYGRPDATEEEILEAARPPSWTGSCAACPTATTRSSTRRAATSAPARSSSSPSPALSSPNRHC
ncbi:ABC transporter ATP-binding protein [Micromonospora sp. M12]